jgi:hypothetical protein
VQEARHKENIMTTNTAAITSKARTVIALERAMAELKAQLDEAKADLLTMVGEGTVDTDVAKVTVVAPTTRSVDLPTLKANMSRAAFAKVTKVAINWSSFDALVRLGGVPQGALDLVEAAPGTRYIKVTAK